MQGELLPLDVALKTDKGRKRPHNEDSIKAFSEPAYDRTGGRLFIVADGVGGESYGQWASQKAVDRIGELFYNYVENNPGTKPELLLKAAIEYTNQEIFDEAERLVPDGQMATTVVTVLIRGNTAHVVWVGDSRAYVVRPGDQQATQISTDHTQLTDRVLRGEITAEQAATMPGGNVLSRSLGGDYNVTADIRSGPIGDGDALVLCSDGLTKYLSDQDIANFVKQSSNPQKAATIMVNEANKRGGADNISVIVVYVGKRKTSDETEIPAGAVPVVAGMSPAGIPRTQKKNNNQTLLIALIVIAVLIIGGMLIALVGGGGEAEPTPTAPIVILVSSGTPPNLGESVSDVTPDPENNPGDNIDGGSDVSPSQDNSSNNPNEAFALVTAEIETATAMAIASATNAVETATARSVAETQRALTVQVTKAIPTIQISTPESASQPQPEGESFAIGDVLYVINDNTGVYTTVFDPTYVDTVARNTKVTIIANSVGAPQYPYNHNNETWWQVQPDQGRSGWMKQSDLDTNPPPKSQTVPENEVVCYRFPEPVLLYQADGTGKGTFSDNICFVIIKIEGTRAKIQPNDPSSTEGGWVDTNVLPAEALQEQQP